MYVGIFKPRRIEGVMLSSPVDFGALAALGRVVRETAEDIQKRKLASLCFDGPDGTFMCRALLVQGAHEACVKLFLSLDRTRMLFFGLDASSICMSRFQKVVELSCLIRIVISEKTSMLLWLSTLPPLLVRFSNARDAELLAAELLECLLSTRTTTAVSEEEDESRLGSKVFLAATSLAHLSHAANQGKFSGGKEDEYFAQLGQTGWVGAIANTLREAMEADTDCRDVLVSSVRKLLTKRVCRRAQQLPSLLKPFFTNLQYNLARIMVL
jgi:hypothetical protein